MNEKIKTRLVSVDFIRGITIAWMILANNPGDYMHIYRQLLHAKWDGWTLTDFVFPTFLFLVGVSVGLSVDRSKVFAQWNWGFWGRVIRRTFVLILLGMAVNAFPHFSLQHLRIPGVLQRIALVYLGVVCLHVWLGSKGLLTVIVTILTGYWMVLEFVPVPGLGYPSISPDFNLEGWLDQKVFRSHIWEYETTWDPEGLLSTFPATAMGLIGVLCGRWLRDSESPAPAWVFCYGLAMCLAGLLWDFSLPINKNLFTSSFVLFVGGSAVMLLALCHWHMDIKGRIVWTSPFVALGVNSLGIFVASEFLAVLLFKIKIPLGQGRKQCLHFFLSDLMFDFWQHHYLASVAWSLSFLSLLFIPAWLMYKRNYVIKI